MPKKSSTAAIAPTPEREHIFPASRLTPLAIKWKELSEAGRHKEAMLLLDEIIRGSTAMFERLAQYENLNSSVDLDILVSAAHEKMVRWLQAWNPKAGRLFTWLCLHKDTDILLEDGTTRKIADLVETKYSGKVKCWNPDKNCFEAHQVTGWNKEACKRDEWRKLMVYGPRGKSYPVFITRDHHVYTNTGWAPVDWLNPRDILYVNQKQLTNEGKALLIGMYLGDGSIAGPDFRVTHGKDQRFYNEWLCAKYHGSLQAPEGERIYWNTFKNAPNDVTGQTVAFIKAGYMWDAYSSLDHPKKVTAWVLDQMTDLSLAAWFMDDGGYTSSNGATTFATQSFTADECAALVSTLKNKFGLTATYYAKTGGLYLNAESKDKFFKIVAPYLLPGFDYKLPEAYRSIPKKDVKLVIDELIPVKHKLLATKGNYSWEVRKTFKLNLKLGWKTEDLSYKYDLTVDSQHNFFAGKHNLLVHNSKCSKNAFLSEVGKVNQMRRRCYTTSDNLERFYGVEDHEVNRHDLAKEYKRRIQDIHCRWGDPQELGALRYLIDCIIDDSHDKQAAIRSAAYCWGISLPMAKFFYNWAVVGLRHQFYEKAYVPFTEYDLMLAAESYTLWPEIINAIGYEPAKKLVVLMGGSRVHIPSINAIAKLKEADQIRREIDRSNLDPATIAEIARKRKKTVRSAAEIYREMLAIQHPNRSGEFSIYGND